MSSVLQDFPELAGFDDGFKPQKGLNIKPSVDVLQDGEYDFEITDAKLDRAKDANKTLLFVIGLRVISGKLEGKEVQKEHWLKDQRSVDILGGELQVYGLDADQWTFENGRKFSEEIVLGIPKLPGVKFQGRKTSKPDQHNPNKIYHNLFVNTRIGAPVASSSTVPPTASKAPPANEDIPF